MKSTRLIAIMLVGFIIGFGVASFVPNVAPFNKLKLLFTAHFAKTPVTSGIVAINDAQKNQLQQSINKIAPELKIEELSSSPLPGIYQVIANNEVFYASNDGRYLMHGDLLDLTKKLEQLSQTEEVRKALRLKALAGVQENEMIIFKPEKETKGIVTVFTDVDCVFCQRLHKDIQKIMDLGVEVRYLAFPRQGKDSESYKKTVSIWCANDTKATLTAAKNGENITANACESNPVAKEYELGLKLNVHGTPTLLFPDGAMLARYMEPNDLAKFAAIHQLENR